MPDDPDGLPDVELPQTDPAKNDPVPEPERDPTAIEIEGENR